jgi:hypothetical protein
MTKTVETGPRPGDIIEIHGNHVGQSGRSGEILEVIGEPGHQHFRVRWEDERESIFYPSSNARVRPRPQARKGTTRRPKT